MPRRTFEARVSTPAGTAEASPQETDVALPQGTLERVDIQVPPGHAGLTGLALEYSGEHIYPWGAGSWLEGDDIDIEAVLDFPLGGSAVTVRTYNTDDTYDHDHLLRFVVQDPTGDERPVTRQLDLAPDDLGIPAPDSTADDVPDVGDAELDDGTLIGEEVTV